LARENKVEEVFNHDGGNYQFVINLAGATKYSQPPEVYQENIIDVSRTCANVAKRHNVTRYIECSTSQVYSHKGSPNGGWAENGTLSPWTGVGSARLEAERAVQGVSGLNHVIIRPALVYGTGDILGVTPRLVIGAIYKQSGEKMELLWSASLKMNTVHVDDCVRAIWHLSTRGNSGAIYNLCDKNDTDQGKINELMEQIYGIKTGFLGKTKSSLAKALGMKNLTDMVNDKHLKPWSDLCKSKGILDTPLTPYLDEELLYKCNNHINGNAIESTGFRYNKPHMEQNSLKEVIADFVQKGIFPTGMIH